MESIAIGVQEPATETAEMRQALDAALRPLAQQGARLDIQEVRRGPLVFLGCRLEADAAAPAVAEFRQALARTLAGWIVDRRERTILRRLIGTRYSYFNPEEREAILDMAAAALDGGGAAEPQKPARRRGRILQRLQEYMERHNTLVLDGFVTFRLKDYVGELAAAVDRAVDDFLLEREYREFVALLRHVVESQTQRPALVHCMFDLAGAFRLEDGAGHSVGTEFLEEVGPEAAARDVGVEDLLVSALITVAPHALRLHVPDGAGVALSQDALATLQEVFPKAVSVCRGCDRCACHAQG